MSENRSLLPAIESKVLKISAASLINTNIVMQRALQRIAAADRGKIILRCDDLPLVPGVQEDFEVIFSTLLTLLLHKGATVSKCFLHINCSSEDKEVTAAGLKPFNIQFYTSSPVAHVLSVHEQEINEVTALLQKQSASLVVNQLKNGGCIFSISIFGKSL